MSVNLGSVKAGGSTFRTVIIKNTGNSDLHINAITTTDGEFIPSDGCTDADIAPGNVCTFTVTFSPPAEFFGKKTAALEIDSTDTRKPVVSVKLRGQAPPPKMSVTPKTLTFGTVEIGNASAHKTVTITNSGLSDLAISNISVSGANAQDFNWAATDCSAIAKGSSCTIDIIFTPSAPASEERGSLDIYSDAPKKRGSSVKLSGKGKPGSTSIMPSPVDDNVLAITVNGSLCSSSTSASYPNKPCVIITVCTPRTSTCQFIDDILLDTGSSGLRIFKQAVNVPLTQVNSGIGSLAECIQYADGSSAWGPVERASVILGNERAVEVPIQVIDSTFGTRPAACGNADQSPADAGFNGILGVGLFLQDCGQACSDVSDNGMYYACDGSSCQGTTVPLSKQLQNPVALLPKDNNGVIVELPSVPLGGVPSVNGYLVLGIGTRENNVPAKVKTYPTDQNGEFITKFNGVSYYSFLGTGSNGLFFASNSLPDCVQPNSDWFCPSSTQSFSAINRGSSGSPKGTVSFDIGNYDSLISSFNNVFAEIGGNDPDYFDWGLPFHFGRNIYVGFEGTASALGSGTYWAY
jgi:hypothetical protein